MSIAIDSNVWYAVTETRVNFTSSMQFKSGGLTFQTIGAGDIENWQFYKLENGNWAIRNQAGGITNQLGVCYVASEIGDSKTQACMVASKNNKAQEWTIDTSWNDGSYRIQNVANGTNYNLDVHPGTPVFMSDEIAKTPKQPAQHWLISSKTDINDGAYSTAVDSGTTIRSSSPASATATPTPTSSTTSAAGKTSNNSSKSSGLSSGAAAGIGVGVALAFIIGIIALFFFIRRRRVKRQSHGLTGTANSGDEKKDAAYHAPVHEAPAHEVSYEMATPPAELSAGEVDKSNMDPAHFAPTYTELPAKSASPFVGGGSVKR